MTNQASPTRGCARKHRLLIQCLVSISICAGSHAMAPRGMAQETMQAYYTSDPESEETGKIRVVSDEAPLLRDRLEDRISLGSSPESDRSDASIPSSSDLPLPAGRDQDFFDLDPPNEVTLPYEVTLSDQFDPLHAPFSSTPMLFDNPSTGAAVHTRSTGTRSTGSALGMMSATPAMVGDGFSGSLLRGSFGGSSVSLAGADRRFKIADNVSPIPQDRVYFNYNQLHHAVVDLNGNDQTLDRFTFGFEKTILNGLASLEMRLPFASGIDSRQDISSSQTRGTELGNLGLALKADLLSGKDWILAAGTSMTIPTGDDYELLLGNAGGLRVNHDAVHIAPFLGWLMQIGGRSFAQGFVQADLDLSGNEVRSVFGGYEGVLQDQNLLFVDLAVGHWLHRSTNPCDCLVGIAAIGELHYTSTLNDSDLVGGLSNPLNRMDVLNATGALHMQLGLTSLRVGGAAPLRSDDQRLFDGEFIVQLNRNF